MSSIPQGEYLNIQAGLADNYKPYTRDPEEVKKADAIKQKIETITQNVKNNYPQYKTTTYSQVKNGNIYYIIVEDNSSENGIKLQKVYASVVNPSGYGPDKKSFHPMTGNERDYKIELNMISGSPIWEKTITGVLTGSPSLENYSSGGKSRRHIKKSLRKRRSKKYKKRRHTKRR